MKALPLLLIAALGACAERSEPDYDSVPANGYNLIDPVRVGDADGLVGGATATTAGSWRLDTNGSMRAVSFAPPQAAPVLRFSCDGRRGMIVERLGLTPAGETTMMVIRVGDQSRRLAVNPTGPEGSILRAALPFNDRLMAALQERPQPIHVRVGEQSPLMLPPSPLVAGLASDCSKA
jgi:hypothetical protein